jgi:hypothetical protein
MSYQAAPTAGPQRQYGRLAFSGTAGQRDSGTAGQRDSGTAGQRDSGLRSHYEQSFQEVACSHG